MARPDVFAAPYSEQQGNAPKLTDEKGEPYKPNRLWRMISLQALKRRSFQQARPQRSSSLGGKQVEPQPTNLDVKEELPAAAPPPQNEDDIDIVCTEPAGSTAVVTAQQKGGVPKILGLLKSGIAATEDLTKLKVPPQFNLPKSQLQLYGEAIYACNQAILNACAEANTPMDRLLAVVRWHVSTVRSPLFGKAPYNPVEGETHHVSAGGLHLLGEQVSHHPPISAVYASNPSKQIRVLWQHQAAPKFSGSSIDVAIKGRRRLFLDAYQEVYELESPDLSFRLLPTPAAQWIGHTTVSCLNSGLAATLHFKAKGSFWGKGQGISGRVGKLGADGRVRKGDELLTIDGHWDGLVYYSEKSNKKAKTLLYDSADAIGNLRAPEVASRKDVSELESCRVWAPLSKALIAQDWNTARKVKQAVEEKQRSVRGKREAAGGQFSPVYFVEKAEGEWVWKGPEMGVPKAPLSSNCQ